MDIEGAASKLLNPIEKHASLIGAGAFLLDKGPFAGHTWGDIQSSIANILQGQVHMPEINNIIADFLNEPWQLPVILAVGGYIAKDATNNPMIKKLAGISQKGATAYLAAMVIVEFLYFSTHSPAPPSSGNAGSYQGSPGPLGPRGYS